jgi:hypothetical protein
MAFVFSACGAESLVESFTAQKPIVTPAIDKMSSSPVDPLKNAVEIVSVRDMKMLFEFHLHLNPLNEHHR